MILEQIAIILGLCFISYGFGFLAGWHRCYDYIEKMLSSLRDKHETDKRADDYF